MDTQANPSSLQSYQMLLYDRALHPELFQLKGRRVVKHAAYEFEGWLMEGSHLLRFEHGPLCACELVTDEEHNLPTAGVVTAFFCAGERDFDHKFRDTPVNYITTVQTETLGENLYLTTFDELAEFARESRALIHRWNDAAGPCLSILDIQRFSREVHAQSYHLLATGGVVLRTQTIFEHA